MRGVDQNEKVKRGKKLKMAPGKSYTEKDSKKEVENSEEDAEEENSKEKEEEEFDAEDCWLRSCLEVEIWRAPGEVPVVVEVKGAAVGVPAKTGRAAKGVPAEVGRAAGGQEECTRRLLTRRRRRWMTSCPPSPLLPCKQWAATWLLCRIKTGMWPRWRQRSRRMSALASLCLSTWREKDTISLCGAVARTC